MIVRQEGPDVIVRLAPDEQRALKLLSEMMYIDDPFVHFSSFSWERNGAGIFTTIRTLGNKLPALKEEPDYPHRRWSDIPKERRG